MPLISVPEVCFTRAARCFIREIREVLASRIRQTANANLYHLTKFSPLKLPLIVYYFYTKITSFTQALSKEIVLSRFYLLIFYFDKFST